MRTLITLILLVITTSAFAQQVQMQFTVNGVYNGSKSYERTTINSNGVEAAFMGTIQNISTGASAIKNFFGMNSPDVEVDGNTTIYRYSADNFIVQEEVFVRPMAAQIGVAGAFTSPYFNAAAGIRTGKYKYVASDMYIEASVLPMVVYRKGRELITGYETDENILDYLFVGYTTGIDTSAPGFILNTRKDYSGPTIGALYTNGNLGISFQYFQDMRKSGFRQSNLQARVVVSI